MIKSRIQTQIYIYNYFYLFLVNGATILITNQTYISVNTPTNYSQTNSVTPESNFAYAVLSRKENPRHLVVTE